MPLTKEQLMIPRVLCIGGEKGEPNDTSGLYITGTIYHFKKYPSDGYECYINSEESNGFPIDFLIKFPHLFRRLEWWEERSVDEMPEYLVDKFGKVNRVLDYNAEFMTVVFSLDDFEESLAHYQPATLEEYEAYINQKQKL